MCRKDMVEEYIEMNRLVQNGKMHIFTKGEHPAIMSNAELAAKEIIKFVNG